MQRQKLISYARRQIPSLGQVIADTDLHIKDFELPSTKSPTALKSILRYAIVSRHVNRVKRLFNHASSPRYIDFSVRDHIRARLDTSTLALEVRWTFSGVGVRLPDFSSPSGVLVVSDEVDGRCSVKVRDSFLTRYIYNPLCRVLVGAIGEIYTPAALYTNKQSSRQLAELLFLRLYGDHYAGEVSFLHVPGYKVTVSAINDTTKCFATKQPFPFLFIDKIEEMVNGRWVISEGWAQNTLLLLDLVNNMDGVADLLLDLHRQSLSKTFTFKPNRQYEEELI